MKRSRLSRKQHVYRVRLKHSNDPDSKFDPVQLAMGVKVELEHTTSKAAAKAIAKAHLAESPKYYTYLHVMENRMREGKL